MKNKLHLITSIRKDIGLIFISALTAICLIDFLLADIPEKFTGGYQLGQIIYKLSMAYISAFIFYFLVVHIKQQKDKDNLYPYVAKKVQMVIENGFDLISVLAKASNNSIANKYPSTIELEAICKSINPNANAPLLLGGLGNYASWVQYFVYSKNRSNEETGKILNKMPFLEAELVNILAKIEDCSHFATVNLLASYMPIKNKDLTNFQTSISEYFELIKQLEQYANKYLAKYK